MFCWAPFSAVKRNCIWKPHCGILCRERWHQRDRRATGIFVLERKVLCKKVNIILQVIIYACALILEWQSAAHASVTVFLYKMPVWKKLNGYLCWTSSRCLGNMFHLASNNILDIPHHCGRRGECCANRLTEDAFSHLVHRYMLLSL